VCYINDDTLPNDSNLTMQIILDVISAEQVALGYLPEVLYMQLDSAPDNKNQWILVLCAIMIAVGLFRKIKLSFLPVGHTHEDIDQLFSRIAEYLRSTDILSLDDLKDAIAGAGKFEGKPPLVRQLTALYDFKSWLAPCIPGFKQITQPMCYKFELDASKSHTLMWARNDMQTSKKDHPTCWFPEDGYQICTTAAARELWKQPIKQIQPRDIDLDEINKTVDVYRQLKLLGEEQDVCWVDELARLQASLDDRCPECAEFRVLVLVIYHMCAIFLFVLILILLDLCTS
jgi:hypothetical protein